MSRNKNVPVTSERIRILRMQAGLSQADVGKVVGASKSSISEYENGDTKISVDVLNRYASYFHVDMDYLTGTDTSDPQAAVPLFTSTETAIILGYRHKSKRERRIMRLQSMSDEEYDKVYGDDEPAGLLNEAEDDSYAAKGHSKKK